MGMVLWICVSSLAIVYMLYREQKLTARMSAAFDWLREMETQEYVRQRFNESNKVLDSHAERLYNLERTNGRIQAALTSEAK